MNKKKERAAVSAQVAKQNCWSPECEENLESITIFNFDRVLFDIKFRAKLGNQTIFLNPIRAICFGHGCEGKVIPVNINSITHFQRHLESHDPSDEWASQVVERLRTLSNQTFDGQESDFPIRLRREVPASVLEKWKYKRPEGQNYLSHWMDILVRLDLLCPSHLIFQQMDALVEMLLMHPATVHDWDNWPTIKQFAIKLGNTLSEGNYHLVRGTHAPSKPLPLDHLKRLKGLMSTINNVSPSLSTLQRWRDHVKLDSGSHPEKVMALISLYENLDGVIYYQNSKVRR